MKMISKTAFLTLLFPLLTINANAATVAIVDSGTDFEHTDLMGREWINPAEIAGNRVDDDRNGKVDDINGWNFVEGYNRLFFRDHVSSIHPITYKLFEVIARRQAKTATQADLDFWNQNVVNLPEAEKEKLLNHLNFYGQYAHGTHVAGVVSYQAPNAKLMVGRMFPDSMPPHYEHSVGFGPFGVTDFVYKLLALVTNGVFDQAAAYLNEKQADVANYSLGISLQMIAKAILQAKGNSQPTDDQIAAETQRIYAQYDPVGRKWIESARQTLFVIAAGNDGTNNDVLPTFPANIRAENSITVAASQGFDGLAEFSNYGITTVDVAAPGVAIESSVPSTDTSMRLPMSGTSMAAPFVAGVAGQIKDINPELKASDIRRILMETVDKKDWLAAKVVSGGVVNAERAHEAARQSRTFAVGVAIDNARSAVADIQTSNSAKSNQRFMNLQDNSVELTEWSKKLLF